MNHVNKVFISMYSLLLLAIPAWAQMGQQTGQHWAGMSGNCPMCGMGWGVMILGFVLTLAAIAALVYLIIYLFRRNRQA